MTGVRVVVATIILVFVLATLAERALTSAFVHPVNTALESAR